MSLLDEEKPALGLLVVLLRSLRHWSQGELARASGIDRGQISLYELGRIVPSEANLRRIAAAAGITWAEARKALTALRSWRRLATRPAGWRPAPPDARKMSAAVGRAAAEAFRSTVHPFLRERIPAFAGPEPPAPAPLPERDVEPAVNGLLITLLRSLRHWTKEELASASRVPRNQISDYEAGRVVPRRGTLERLAAAVGVPLGVALEALPFLRELVRTKARGSILCRAVPHPACGRSGPGSSADPTTRPG
jgi:transcriptional regulator with XRE-family HTH domain